MSSAKSHPVFFWSQYLKSNPTWFVQTWHSWNFIWSNNRCSLPQLVTETVRPTKKERKNTYIHTYIHTYMFVVVNFDALAQASDIRIERRQVIFLCWMQDSNPRSQTPIRQQTECPLTNRLSYRGSSKNLNSTAYDQQAFSPIDLTANWLSHLALATYIHTHTCIHACMHAYIHTYIHTYIHICCC